MRSLALFTLLAPLLASAPVMGSDFAFTTGAVMCESETGCEISRENSTASISLFIEIGNAASSTPCVTGALGDEICGFDVTIEIGGSLSIVSFTPPANVTFSPPPPNTTTTTIHAVGLNALTAVPGRQQIGVLVLDVVESDRGTVTVNGTVVSAGLEVAKIEEEEVAFVPMLVVPEPDATLVLIAGILMLGALHSLRTLGIGCPGA